MELVVEIKKNIIVIKLNNKGRIVDETSFLDQHDLTEKMLKLMDAFLKKNKLKITDIKKTKLLSDSNESFTSDRIIRTILNTISWANKRTLDKI